MSALEKATSAAGIIIRARYAKRQTGTLALSHRTLVSGNLNERSVKSGNGARSSYREDKNPFQVADTRLFLLGHSTYYHRREQLHEAAHIHVYTMVNLVAISEGKQTKRSLLTIVSEVMAFPQRLFASCSVTSSIHSMVSRINGRAEVTIGRTLSLIDHAQYPDVA